MSALIGFGRVIAIVSISASTVFVMRQPDPLAELSRHWGWWALHAFFAASMLAPVKPKDDSK